MIEVFNAAFCFLFLLLFSPIIIQASMLHKRVLQLDSSNVEAIASLGAQQVVLSRFIWGFAGYLFCGLKAGRRACIVCMF